MNKSGEDGVGVAVVGKQVTELMKASGEILGYRRYCSNLHDVSPTAKSCPQCGCKKFTVEPIEIGMMIDPTKELATESPTPMHGNYGCIRQPLRA
ncbi:hypothetical protein HGA34_04475 [Candidatus Falkowbacteria bacterium]|nr:hypothetical protein [Candidatus Falkowbacteria bacterium]